MEVLVYSVRGCGTYLTSAGTVSPTFNSTMSPGTISFAGTVAVLPSRETTPVGELSDRSESMVFSAA